MPFVVKEPWVGGGAVCRGYADSGGGAILGSETVHGEDPLGLSEKVSSAELISTRIEGSSWRYVLGVPDPNGAVLFMVVVSLLYALLAPWLLRRVAGQPTAFVWTTSLLACSYFSMGAIRLPQMMGFMSFFRISYIALLSVATAHFIGPNSGAAVDTLLTFYAAGMLGTPSPSTSSARRARSPPVRWSALHLRAESIRSIQRNR